MMPRYYVNSKQWAEARTAFNKLRKHYRSAFPRQAVPLKVGIDKDIVAGGRLTEHEARLGLAYYVGTPGYLKACTRPGAMRHDLSGDPVAPVSATEAAYAADPSGLHLSDASAHASPEQAQEHGQ